MSQNAPSLLRATFKFYFIINVPMYDMLGVGLCHSVLVEVIEQLCGVGSLLPLSLEIELGLEWQAPLPTEPSWRPLLLVLLMLLISIQSSRLPKNIFL